MENKKDIGKAFRDKLEPVRKSPDDALWDAIYADLQKKKKRRIVPFWFIFTSVSLGLLALVLVADKTGYVGLFPEAEATDKNSSIQNVEMTGGAEKIDVKTGKINDASSTGKNRMAVENENSLNENGLNGDGENGNRIGNANGSGSNIKKKESGEKASGKKYKKPAGKNYGGKMVSVSSGAKKAKQPPQSTGAKNGIAGQNEKWNPSINDGKNALSDESTSAAIASKSTDGEAQTNGLPELPVQDSLTQKALAENKKPKRKKEPKDSTAAVTVEADEAKSFSIFLYAAPAYNGFFAEKSSLDRSLDSISGKSELVFNYGGYFCFRYDEKWSFRFGFAKTVFKHKTTGIRINGDDSPAAPPNFSNVQYASGTTNLSVAEQLSNSFSMDIEQEFSYFEFPVEVKYAFYNGPVSMHAIGGFSTLFLKTNTVEAIGENDGSVHMGETKNILKAHFTANFGIGFNYKFAENFQLNLEPMFKYHINMGEIKQKPYTVLLQTGIEYTFHSKNKKKKTGKK